MNTTTIDVGNLDHLVVTTTDLERASDEFEARLGVRPQPGGRHPQFGTHNALLGLTGAAYVELIAIDPQAEARGDYPFGLADEAGTSACTFAAHPGDLSGAAATLAGLGFDVGPIGPGSRTTPDGTVLDWQLTRPLAADPHGLVPFLIDWLGGPSPADTATALVALTAWGASHPEPEPVGAALASLGVPLAVQQGEPRFWVELTGPKGSWRL